MTARQLFDANVWTVLQANCVSCHANGTNSAPIFLAADGPGSYSKLTADARMVNNAPPKSELITQGKHEGPALTADQGTAIQNWLTAENAEHVGLPVPPAPANLSQRALETFGGCMQLTDWNASGMNDLQNQNTNGQGICSSCHETGMYVMLSQTPNANFAKMHTMPFLMKFAVADTNPDGSLKDIIAANRFADRGKEPGHPAYTLNTARANALTQFFTLTYAHYKAGNCPAPTP